MKNPETTIGSLIDRQNTSFIGSIDQNGFPNVKAMLPPRKREGIKTFYFTTNTSSKRGNRPGLLRPPFYRILWTFLQ